MKNRFRRQAPATLVLACALAASATAHATPASVQLRVEGRSTTTFEGPVTTDGKVVRPTSGDDHVCDGTGPEPDAPGSPGPTPTSALDDGKALGNYTWDGRYFPSFGDYLIDRIGPDAATDSEFWGEYVNAKSGPGGCSETVKTGDEVLWAFDAFSKAHVSRLTGPGSATTGKPFNVRVTDGANGSALAGASVGGRLTGSDGVASLQFDQAGIYTLKATRADSVRSNALNVCIDPPGAAACTSTDKSAPKVTVLLDDDTLATERGRSRTLLFAWRGDDGGGSGVTGYSVDVARMAAAGVTSSADVFRRLVERTQLTRAYFRGRSGSSYRFRVTAFDRATNNASFDSAVISIPVDDRDRGLLKLSRGWKRLRRQRAWGRTVVRSTGKGDSARLRFRGRRVVLIGRKLRLGGRVKVTVDGKSRVLSVRGTPRYKSVLFRSRRLRAGTHTFRMRTLGRSAVELDAVAPLP